MEQAKQAGNLSVNPLPPSAVDLVLNN